MPDETSRNEELQRKIAESKRKALEEESRRIEQDAERRSQDLAKRRFQQDESEFESQLKAAEDVRHQQEEELRRQQEETDRKLAEEKRKKEEALRQQEEKQAQQKEEERLRRENELRLQLQEEERRKTESERRRAEEEGIRQEEEARKREEEAQKREEEERLRKEEEERNKEERERLRLQEEERKKSNLRRLQEEEKLERIRSLIKNARNFYESKELENASVEIAKALVNDPENVEALELEQKIHEAQGRTHEGPAEPLAKPIAPKKQKTKSTQRVESQKKSRAPLYIVLFILIAVVGVVVYRQLKEKVFFETLSVAVFPLQTSSLSSEQEFIGSAVSAVISEEMQKHKQILPMGFSSAYRFSNQGTDAELTLHRLGYQYIMKGAVSFVDDQYIVDITLVDSAGKSPWSARFQKSQNDLSRLPGEIIQQLITGLNISVKNEAVLNTNINVPGDVYLLYLQGKAKCYPLTDQNTRDALQVFGKVISADEKFVKALSSASFVQTARFEQGWDKNRAVLDQAKQWAQDAVAADSSSLDGHLALANVLLNQHDYDGSMRELEAATNTSDNSMYSFVKANVLLRQGRVANAIEEIRHAYTLDPRDPDILLFFARALQLKGNADEGFSYHSSALTSVDDSTGYFVDHIADALLYDAGLSLAYSNRLADACNSRIQSNAGDYRSLYYLARMLQTSGNGLRADTILRKAEFVLRKEVQLHPKNTNAVMYLALTLTRLGKFPEAISNAKNASQLESGNDWVKYKVAQMYSLQMYSQKKKEIDAKKKGEALKALRDALGLRYRLEEITSGDFYNLYEQAEFRSLIGMER